jgi:cytochrome c oxidase cbb3-type subunit 3
MKSGKSLLLVCLCLFGLLASAPSLANEDQGQAAPLLVVRTFKTMDEALFDLKNAIADRNYVFIRQQNVDSRLTHSATENQEVVLVYFCNFHMADRALKIDPRVGVFMPCKITLIRRADHIQMVAINPHMMSKQLQRAELGEICKQLTRDYKSILKEASL